MEEPPKQSEMKTAQVSVSRADQISDLVGTAARYAGIAARLPAAAFKTVGTGALGGVMGGLYGVFSAASDGSEPIDTKRWPRLGPIVNHGLGLTGSALAVTVGAAYGYFHGLPGEITLTGSASVDGALLSGMAVWAANVAVYATMGVILGLREGATNAYRSLTA